jgi:hypothetical protein
VSDRVHEEAYDLARECVNRWLDSAARTGLDLQQMRQPGPADPIPFIAEAIAAAITGRDPAWETVTSEPARQPSETLAIS